MQTFDLVSRAAAVLAGGCDSPVRSGWSVGGAPFMQTRGEGAYAYDELGDRYIDYVMAYGPLLFGHTHPELTTNLDELAQRCFHRRVIQLAVRWMLDQGISVALRETRMATDAFNREQTIHLSSGCG